MNDFDFDISALSTGLKDDIDEDIDTIINGSEFAETAEINGVLVMVQVSTYTAEKSSMRSETFDGLHGDFVKIYFRAAPYLRKKKRLPKKGEWVMLRGRRYDVVRSKNEMGVARIDLSAYRQNDLGRRSDVNVYNNI